MSTVSKNSKKRKEIDDTDTLKVSKKRKNNDDNISKVLKKENDNTDTLKVSKKDTNTDTLKVSKKESDTNTNIDDIDIENIIKVSKNVKKEPLNLTLSFDLNEWRTKQLILEKTSEPLLSLDNHRDCLYPIIHEDLWNFYLLHLSTHWVAHEIDYSKDNDDIAALTKDERHFFEFVLAFFAGSDFLVNESQKKESDEITVLEDKFFNDDKTARENIHSISYADLLEVYVKNEIRRNLLKNAIKEIPVIKKKSIWFRDYIQNGTYVERLIATSITEGIFFSGSFCSIFWAKKRGILPATCDLNEFIARDEGIHRDYCCYKYRIKTVNKLPEELVIHMIKMAVLIEQEFICEAIPCSLIGMNNELMSQYIEFVADHLCFNLIGKTIYNVENPFNDWMKAQSLKVKTDFFAHRPTTYSDTSVLSEKSENTIRFDDTNF